MQAQIAIKVKIAFLATVPHFTFQAKLKYTLKMQAMMVFVLKN
jgi:hypothetical protein